METGNVSVGKFLNNEDIIQDQIDDLILELIKERKKNKITQIELSRITGIPQATISRLESFSSIPTLQILIRISNALGLTLFLNRVEEENEN